MAYETLKDARAAYKTATGKNPSPRDDIAALEAKIAAHQPADNAGGESAGSEGAGDAGDAAGADNAADNGTGEEAAPKPKAKAKAKAAAPEAPEGTAYVRHPEHIGCSFRGVEITPDKEGLCLVPLSAVEDLSSHGFALVK